MAIVIDFAKCRNILQHTPAVCVYVVEEDDAVFLEYTPVGADWQEQLRAIVYGVGSLLHDDQNLSLEGWKLEMCNYPSELMPLHTAMRDEASTHGLTVRCAWAEHENLRSEAIIAGYLGNSVVVVECND